MSRGQGLAGHGLTDPDRGALPSASGDALEAGGDGARSTVDLAGDRDLGHPGARKAQAHPAEPGRGAGTAPRGGHPPVPQHRGRDLVLDVCGGPPAVEHLDRGAQLPGDGAEGVGVLGVPAAGSSRRPARRGGVRRPSGRSNRYQRGPWRRARRGRPDLADRKRRSGPARGGRGADGPQVASGPAGRVWWAARRCRSRVRSAPAAAARGPGPAARPRVARPAGSSSCRQPARTGHRPGPERASTSAYRTCPYGMATYRYGGVRYANVRFGGWTVGAAGAID